jgi:transketolase
MGEVQGQGYIGQALGWADVLAVAYCHAMQLRPDDPTWEGRDRFLLSHGHYAIAHYAALIEAGVIPESELETYGSDDSRLPISGMATYTPGMEISGGSLGQGLAIAVGMALGLKQKRKPRLCLQLHVRWELNEGATWEAALAASHHELDNLVCLVDVNNQQADGPSTKVLGSSLWPTSGRPLAGMSSAWMETTLKRWRRRSTQRAPSTRRSPRVILLDTLMGKGVPFLEKREKNHFIRVDPPEWQQALNILDQNRPATKGEGVIA